MELEAPEVQFKAKSPGHQLPHLVAIFLSWPTVTSEIDNGSSVLLGFTWCDYIEVLLDQRRSTSMSRLLSICASSYRQLHRDCRVDRLVSPPVSLLASHHRPQLSLDDGDYLVVIDVLTITYVGNQNAQHAHSSITDLAPIISSSNLRALSLSQHDGSSRF